MTEGKRELAEAAFKIDFHLEPRSLAPQTKRARRADYDNGYGSETFPYEIIEEGGPDKSVYLMGAQWEGPVRGAYEELPDKHGYFIAERKTGPWRWVLWRCAWNDDGDEWYWASSATDWATEDAAAAGRELIRRVWLSWTSMDGPSEIDDTGMLSHDTIMELVETAFGGLTVPVDDEEE